MLHSNHDITKENLDFYLRELGKVFRKKNGTKTPAEIIIVGGASMLINYNFRESTEDIDAIIHASSVMQESVFAIAEKFGLPNDWLNDDFHFTSSYTTKLIEHSKYYRTFSNILQVRTVTDEYLVAMKLMAGRADKYDFSDIEGILFELGEKGTPISLQNVKEAVCELYGSWEKLPLISREYAEKIFATFERDGKTTQQYEPDDLSSNSARPEEDAELNVADGQNSDGLMKFVELYEKSHGTQKSDDQDVER